MKKPTVAAIIPAYNEAENIGNVLKVFLATPECDEVIVVDDGSSDQTAAIAKQCGARVITQKNQGKGVAMHTGVEATNAPLIFFADADLTGLTSDHLRSLINPVTSGEVAMTVGLRDRGRFLTTVLPYIAPVLGGERVMRREIFEALSGNAAKDFGIETLMNAYCAKHHLPVRYIPTWGLGQVIKEKKYGFWPGLYARLRMVYQILRAEIAAFRIQ